jgi:hypothetical protein
MRTTIDIPNALYRRIKARAAAEGKPAKALILAGVEQVLSGQAPERRRKLKLPIIKSQRPGSLHLDNARIYDLLFPA